MQELLTRKGVLVDVCPSCQGVWLDEGEINFFISDKKILNRYETKGLEQTYKTSYKCPKCQSEMRLGRIHGFPYQVEECSSCRGIFFDSHEFKKIQGKDSFKSFNWDRSVCLREKPKDPSSLPIKPAPHKKTSSGFFVKLPSLGLTTGLVCFSMYSVLFALIVFLMEVQKLPLSLGIISTLGVVALQFYFSPIILDWQLRFLGSLKWLNFKDIPSAVFKKSLTSLCQENRIPIPKVGIIDDKTPQAYTYGRTPHSARLVFSKGMFEILDEEELTAVLAHEIGHIKHWDFVVMTVIQVIPLLLYTIYRFIKTQMDDKKSKDSNKLGAVLVVSYIFYMISEYLVLFVSRVREYHADKFSCYATKKPNKLLTALVKISYGLLSHSASSDSEDNSREDRIKGVETLNIMGFARSKQLALARQGEEDQFNPQSVEDVMRWDLWSPWAFYYELHSTHPLTAKRINAIGSYALSMNQEPYLLFKKEKPESYWDDFFIDVFVLFLPYILALGCGGLWFGLTGNSYTSLGKENIPLIIDFLVFVIFGLALGGLIRTLRAYPKGRFLHHSVASLLKLIKVSPVRSYPVTLKGYILGRGDAGNIFSEDLVLRDKTGMMFLNHEPFGLNILFALFRYKKFQGKNVQVRGWYRRSPSPYLEVRDIRLNETSSYAYTYYYKIGFCLLGLLIAFVYFLI